MRTLANALFLLLNFMLFVAAMALDFPGGGIVFYVVLLGLEFIAVLVHELAHAWMARRLGSNVYTINVMGIEWHPGWHPSRRVPPPEFEREVGGYVLYQFDKFEPSRREEGLIAIAGPMANLVLALAAFGMAVTLQSATLERARPPIMAAAIPGPPSLANEPDLLPSDEKIVLIFERERSRQQRRTIERAAMASLILLALLSAGIGLINLIPFKGSDGETVKDWIFWK